MSSLSIIILSFLLSWFLVGFLAAIASTLRVNTQISIAELVLFTLIGPFTLYLLLLIKYNDSSNWFFKQRDVFKTKPKTPVNTDMTRLIAEYTGITNEVAHFTRGNLYDVEYSPKLYGRQYPYSLMNDRGKQHRMSVDLYSSYFK